MLLSKTKDKQIVAALDIYYDVNVLFKSIYLNIINRYVASSEETIDTIQLALFLIKS